QRVRAWSGVGRKRPERRPGIGRRAIALSYKVTKLCSPRWRSSRPVSAPSPLHRPIFALPGRWNVEHLAVLGHGTPGDRVAGLLKFGDQVFIAPWIGFIFLVDNLEQVMLDGFPGHFFARGGLRSAAEEAFEREDATRRLHPLVVDGPAHRGDVDAYLLGYLLH